LLRPRERHLPLILLLLHHSLPSLAVLVLVLVGAEVRARELLDKALRHLDLVRAELRLAADADLAEVPHLVGIEHRVEDEAAVVGPDDDQVLLATAAELRERDLAARTPRLAEQLVPHLLPP